VTWARTAELGSLYPFGSLPIVDDGLRFKQKFGGVISKKVRGGEVFARRGGTAENPRTAADAARLVEAIKTLQKSGNGASRLEINEARHVLHRRTGQLFFICALDEGLEFPQVDQK
jgi:hypothetical protein